MDWVWHWFGRCWPARFRPFFLAPGAGIPVPVEGGRDLDVVMLGNPVANPVPVPEGSAPPSARIQAALFEGVGETPDAPLQEVYFRVLNRFGVEVPASWDWSDVQAFARSMSAVEGYRNALVRKRMLEVCERAGVVVDIVPTDVAGSTEASSFHRVHSCASVEDRASLLSRARFVLSDTPLRRGIGTSMLSAMAAGAVPVLPRSPWIAGNLSAQECLQLDLDVPTADPALPALVADETRRVSMVRAGERAAAERFTWRATARRLCQQLGG